MGKIYNISLRENFLETVVEFLKKEIGPKELKQYRAVLPNNRSCGAFKNCSTWNMDGTTLEKCRRMLSIVSISDMIEYDSPKISARISHILRKRNPNIPISTVFELAQSVNDLIKDLVLNKVDYGKLRRLVPEDLMENWEHTVRMIEECVNDEKIREELEKAEREIESFEDIKDYLILVGVGNTNYFTRKLAESIEKSRNGLIFVEGDKGSHNESYNREVLGRADWEELWKEREEGSNGRKIELEEFANTLKEAEGIGAEVDKALKERKSVLIVSPDMSLSKRIKSDLLQRDIVADDLYGDVFAECQEGLLINLILDAVLDEFSTRSCLKIFKMIDAKNTMEMELFLRKERGIFPKFEEGAKAFRENEEKEKQKEEREEGTDAVPRETFWNMIDRFFEVMKDQKFKEERKTFGEWSEIVKGVVEVLVGEEKREKENKEEGEAEGKFKEILAEYEGYSESFGKMRFGEYAIFLRKHCLRTAMRHPEGYTEGVIMLGAIEAQILDADLVIIAGANEKNFTSGGQEDFWLSDSMKRSLGIPTREHKDRFMMCIFERLANKNEVLITRSKKVAGEEQIMYGLVDHMGAKKRGEATSKEKNEKEKIRKTETGEVRGVEEAEKTERKIKLAAGNPPMDRRPDVFSVSDVERLKDNPYAFYADKILGLKELDEVDEIKNLRGNYIHKVLDNYVRRKYGDDIYKTAEMTLKELKVDERALGLWYFGIDEMLKFVKANEAADAQEVLKSISEKWGERELEINISEENNEETKKNEVSKKVKIRCRADRIDLLKNGEISIIDYKTSQTKIPKKSVQNGDKPQLILEAWIAEGDGFGIKRDKVASVQYWFLKKECEKLVIGEKDLDCSTWNTINKVEELIRGYNVRGDAYEVNPEYKFWNGYMHLARMKEWRN